MGMDIEFRVALCWDRITKKYNNHTRKYIDFYTLNFV